MRRLLQCACLAAVILATRLSAAAEPNHAAVMAEANQAFQKGDYAAAATEYQQLVSLGTQWKF